MCETSGPPPDFTGSGPVEYYESENSDAQTPDSVLARAEAELLDAPGVVSVGIGYGPAGGEALIVGTLDAGVAKQLPAEIEGVPVIATVIGEVDALRNR